MNLPRLMATFRPQAWIRDYASDIDGRTEFDATVPFLRQSLETIKSFHDQSYDSDYLADDLDERQGHSGPFEVDVDPGEWFDKLGIPCPSTQSDLEELRKMFGIDESRMIPGLLLMNVRDKETGESSSLQRRIRVKNEDNLGLRIILDDTGRSDAPEHDLLIERQADRWLILFHPNGSDPLICVNILKDQVTVEQDLPHTPPVLSLPIDPPPLVVGYDK